MTGGGRGGRGKGGGGKGGGGGGGGGEGSEGGKQVEKLVVGHGRLPGGGHQVHQLLPRHREQSQQTTFSEKEGCHSCLNLPSPFVKP